MTVAWETPGIRSHKEASGEWAHRFLVFCLSLLWDTKSQISSYFPEDGEGWAELSPCTFWDLSRGDSTIGSGGEIPEGKRVYSVLREAVLFYFFERVLSLKYRHHWGKTKRDRVLDLLGQHKAGDRVMEWQMEWYLIYILIKLARRSEYRAKSPEVRQWWNTSLIPDLGRQWQRDLCSFKATLGFTRSHLPKRETELPQTWSLGITLP